MDGETYTFPIAASAFNDNGWFFDNQGIASPWVSAGQIFYDNDLKAFVRNNSAIRLYLVNRTSQAVLADEADAYGIVIGPSASYDEYPEQVVVGDTFILGENINELTERYGTPFYDSRTSQYEKGEYLYATTAWRFVNNAGDELGVNAAVELETGKVVGLSLTVGFYPFV